MSCISISIRKIQYAFLLVLTLISSVAYASVNIRTGELELTTETDFYGMQREYRHADQRTGLFGKKWKTVYDTRLQVVNAKQEVVIFNALTSKQYSFNNDGENNWQGTRGALVEIENGFIWDDNSSRYFFNQQGALVEYHNEADGVFILGYDDKGYLSRFITPGKVEYQVETNDEGLIVRVTKLAPAEDYAVEYVYQQGLLVHIKEITGEVVLPVVEYRYDKNHYLVFKGDKYSTLSVRYAKYGDQVRVESHKDGVSDKRYRYRLLADYAGEKHFEVAVETTKENKINTVKYEYVDLYAGENFLYSRQYKKYQGDELVYHAEYKNKCKPIFVDDHNYKTRYRYDDHERMVSKDTEFSTIKYSYNEGNKITFVQKIFKGESPTEKWTRYAYSENNKLTYAENSDGMTVDLSYNAKGNIISMRTQQETLFFEYNHMNKPVRITVHGLGSVNVAYNELGDITSVKSDDGSHKLALEITRAFQKLLLIIKPVKN